MGTRSRIGVADSHGIITSVYSHWDGYPAHVGKLLATVYNTEGDARELVSLGNISSLGERLHPDPDQPHTFTDAVPGVTVFYERDRGEEDQAASDHTDADWPSCGQEWLYLWMEGLGWHYRQPDEAGWHLLSEHPDI